MTDGGEDAELVAPRSHAASLRRVPTEVVGEERRDERNVPIGFAPALPAGVSDENTACFWAALEPEAYVCELMCEWLPESC